MLRTCLALALMAWMFACGDERPSTVDAPPRPGTLDARADANANCSNIDECAWIDEELGDIVAALSGQTEVSPGVRLAHRASISERAASRALLTATAQRLGLDIRGQPYVSGENMVIHLQGTNDAAPHVVMGAHFDSVPAGPGAADNATGTAMAIVTAAYLAKQPRQRSIDFVLFDEEELGLIGSRAYVDELQASGAAVHAMHNYDMLSFDGDGDRVLELWSPTPGLAALYQRVAAERSMSTTTVSFTRSDHQAFLEAGMPAVGVGEEFSTGDHTPHYHQSTDSFDKVDFAFLGDVTRLAIVAVGASANEP